MIGKELFLRGDYLSLKFSIEFQLDAEMTEAIRQGMIDSKRGHVYQWIPGDPSDRFRMICMPCVWGTHVGCLNGYYHNDACSCEDCKIGDSDDLRV